MAKSEGKQPLIYNLKHPFVYSKGADSGAEKTCRGIEFRRPKGTEADRVFSVVFKIKEVAEGNGVPVGLAALVIDYISTFGSIVGDKDFDLELVAGNLDSADVFPLAELIAENFM